MSVSAAKVVGPADGKAGVAQAAPEELGALCQRFALDMDPSSVPDLIERFGVRFPAEPLRQLADRPRSFE